MNQDVRIKRLRYRSSHRGCKETDLVLGQFAEHSLPVLAPELLGAYEQLLDEDDAHIWDWLTGVSQPEAVEYLPLLALMKQYRFPA